MIPGDETLELCNESELLQLARAQGLPPLRRGLPRSDLIKIVRGEVDPHDAQIAGTLYTRKKLEGYISDHWAVVMSQLPGCNGKCVSYHCSEGKHLLCFSPNEAAVQ